MRYGIIHTRYKKQEENWSVLFTIKPHLASIIATNNDQLFLDKPSINPLYFNLIMEPIQY